MYYFSRENNSSISVKEVKCRRIIKKLRNEQKLYKVDYLILFDMLRDYLRENPGENIFRVSHATKIPIWIIIKFLREGKISLIKYEDNILNQCSKCGVILLYGDQCDGCLKDRMDFKINDSIARRRITKHEVKVAIDKAKDLARKKIEKAERKKRIEKIAARIQNEKAERYFSLTGNMPNNSIDKIDKKVRKGYGKEVIDRSDKYLEYMKSSIKLNNSRNRRKREIEKNVNKKKNPCLEKYAKLFDME